MLLASVMEWKISDGLVNYPEAVEIMEQRAADIAAGHAPEMVWLLEHPPLYTSGTSANAGDLLEARFPVYESGRGGQFTYHGPGQRIGYVMLDLKKREAMDVRAYVQKLEQWIIGTLAQFGVKSFTRDGRIGVWTLAPSPLVGEGWGGGALSKNSMLEPVESYPPSRLPPQGGKEKKEAKIAALGIRLRKWVSFHGVSLNVNPDLSHYSGIVPCGINEFGVTSLAALGVKVSVKEVDAALKKEFERIF